MSKQTPSRDFNYKFEHNWGGEDNWYTKGKRWANKQKFPINHLALGAIEWLRERWVDGRVELEMASVDKQAEEIRKAWEEDDDRHTPEFVQTGVFGEEGWSISMSNKSIGGGSEEPESGMGTTGNEARLEAKVPDPWDSTGDWNDWAIGFDNEYKKRQR